MTPIKLKKETVFVVVCRNVHELEMQLEQERCRREKMEAKLDQYKLDKAYLMSQLEKRQLSQSVGSFTCIQYTYHCDIYKHLHLLVDDGMAVFRHRRQQSLLRSGSVKIYRKRSSLRVNSKSIFINVFVLNLKTWALICML